MRVLIVDDDDAFCIATERVLRARGYETDRAVDGIDALDRMNLHPPDVVLCDFRMPRMDGMSLLLRVREGTFDIPFVMVTGNRVESEAIAAIRAGAREVLDKPIDPERLLECIRDSS